jgi:hypothetical protein
MVGKWSWSSMDAASEYIFKPDHSFVVLLPDRLNQTGEMEPEIHGAWAFELGFLILEYRSGSSDNLPKRKDRLPVSKVSETRIALRDGSYFERVRD